MPIFIIRFYKCIKLRVYFSMYINLVHAQFLLVSWYDWDRINGSLPILTHSWQVHTRWWLTRNRRCVYLYVILFHLSFVHEMYILVHWSFFLYNHQFDCHGLLMSQRMSQNTDKKENSVLISWYKKNSFINFTRNLKILFAF